QTLLSTQLPPNTTVSLDWRAVWFTVAVTLVSAALVGLVPGVQASRPQLIEALKDGTRGSSSARAGRFRSALMIAEVALAVVLLVGSGLLLLSFLKLQRSEPGFDPGGVAAVERRHAAGTVYRRRAAGPADCSTSARRTDDRERRLFPVDADSVRRG